MEAQLFGHANTQDLMDAPDELAMAPDVLAGAVQSSSADPSRQWPARIPKAAFATRWLRAGVPQEDAHWSAPTARILDELLPEELELLEDDSPHAHVIQNALALRWRLEAALEFRPDDNDVSTGDLELLMNEVDQTLSSLVPADDESEAFNELIARQRSSVAAKAVHFASIAVDHAGHKDERAAKQAELKKLERRAARQFTTLHQESPFYEESRKQAKRTRSLVTVWVFMLMVTAGYHLFRNPKLSLVDNLGRTEVGEIRSAGVGPSLIAVDKQKTPEEIKSFIESQEKEGHVVVQPRPGELIVLPDVGALKEK